MAYAEGTSVSVRKSRMDIEDMLERARARASYTAQSDGRAVVGFQLEDKHIRFELALPSKDEFSIRAVRGRKTKATPDQQDASWEQACRERWRALVLALKAKFVSIEAGVESTEEAFLAHVVLANRQTVLGWFRAQMEKGGGAGVLPPLLGPGEEAGP